MAAPGRTTGSEITYSPGGGYDLVVKPNSPEETLRHWVAGDAFPRVVIDIANFTIKTGNGTAAPVSLVAGGGANVRVFYVSAVNATAAEIALATFVCDGTNDQVQIQQAQDAAAAAIAGGAEGAEVELSSGLFNVNEYVAGDGSPSATYNVAVRYYSHVWTHGAGKALTRIRLGNDQADVTDKNYVFLNKNRSSATPDVNVRFSDLTIDCNGPNQATQIRSHGLSHWTVDDVLVERVDVFDQKGTNNSTNESFGFDANHCGKVRYNDCSAWASPASAWPGGIVNCSTGFETEYSTLIEYNHCWSWGHATANNTGAGYGTYNSTGITFNACFAWLNQTGGFNNEISECIYNSCWGGLTASSNLTAASAVFTPAQDLGNGTGFVINGLRTGAPNAGAYPYTAAGVRTISVLNNCQARNNTNGVVIQGFRDDTAAAGTNATDVFSTGDVFVPSDPGGYCRIGNGPLVKINTWVSTKHVTVFADPRAADYANGQVLTVGNVHAEINGGDIAECSGSGITLSDANQNQRTMAGIFTRIRAVKMWANDTHMNGFGPAGGGLHPYGVLMGEDGATARTPAVPATGVLLYNSFGLDCVVHIDGTGVTWSGAGTTGGQWVRGSGASFTNSLLSTLRLTAAEPAAGTGRTVLLPAGAAIMLVYSAGTPTWVWQSLLMG